MLVNKMFPVSTLIESLVEGTVSFQYMLAIFFKKKVSTLLWLSLVPLYFLCAKIHTNDLNQQLVDGLTVSSFGFLIVPCHSTEILRFQEISKFRCSLDKMDILAPHMGPSLLEFPVIGTKIEFISRKTIFANYCVSNMLFSSIFGCNLQHCLLILL